MAYNFFYKKAGYTSTHTAAEIEISENRELAYKLQKPITKNFLKSKVHSSSRDNIYGIDVRGM